MDADFTFKNELIHKYFEGDNSYIPSGELIYLHEHPLVTPNFLTELQDIILDFGKYIKAKNITGYPIQKLSDIAIKIGINLPTITYETAPIILAAMREAYKLCKDLKK